MRYLLLVGLVLVGCSGKGEEKQTRFKPSELLAMKELPANEIILVGKVAFSGATKQDARPRKVMVIVEDNVISTKDKKEYVNVVFESEEKDFSDSFVKWVESLYDERRIEVKGKLLRTDKGQIFLYNAELQ